MKQRIAHQLRRIARRLDPPRPITTYSINSAADVSLAERRLADTSRRQMDQARWLARQGRL